MPKVDPNHPFEQARRAVLHRTPGTVPSKPEKLEPGVNFFVLVLECLGAETCFSCEGHPSGFYVAFRAPHVECGIQ